MTLAIGGMLNTNTHREKKTADQDHHYFHFVILSQLLRFGSTSSNGSDKPANLCSVTNAFASLIHNVEKWRKAQTKTEPPSLAGYVSRVFKGGIHECLHFRNNPLMNP